ncbi:secretin N-terminal domain-containing protein [Providencia sp. Me31A]|uniref:secretin N-terminal domain-containing protein n=1 Tax=Providencia sp. Me31A TaxID=3392637 RepID=UPI003D289D4E
MNNKLINPLMFIFGTIFWLPTFHLFAHEMRDPFQAPPPIEEKMQPATSAATTNPATTAPPLIEKIFKLISTDAQEVHRQLKHPDTLLLSKESTVYHDIATNSIIIKDNPERIALVEEWLKQQDKPNQQVQITAHIISSSRTALQELGLEWGMLAGSSTHSHLNRYNRYYSAPGQFAFNVLRLNEGLLELKLNALEKENLLSIIASPRLVASHQQPASIQQGTEIPYVTSSEKKTHVQFKDAVLGMDVTPTIIRNKKIEMNLKISHNSPDTALTSGQNHHLAINKQEISTSVTVKHNETLVLGGIFQQKKEKTATGLPFLSDIPLLGALFTNTAEHIDKRVLIVFITPKLINI